MSHVLSTSSTQLGQGPAVLRPILLFHRFRFLTLGSNVYLVFPLLMCVLSHVWLFATLQTVACQAPLPLGFPKKEYWSELPFPDSGDLPDSGFEPMSLASSWLKVWTHVSCISHTGRQILYHWATSETLPKYFLENLYQPPLSLSSRGFLVPLHFLP